MERITDDMANKVPEWERSAAWPAGPACHTNLPQVGPPWWWYHERWELILLLISPPTNVTSSVPSMNPIYNNTHVRQCHTSTHVRKRHLLKLKHDHTSFTDRRGPGQQYWELVRQLGPPPGHVASLRSSASVSDRSCRSCGCGGPDEDLQPSSALARARALLETPDGGGQSFQQTVVFDANREAQGRGFFDVGATSVSDDGCLIAVTFDAVGDERFALMVQTAIGAARVDLPSLVSHSPCIEPRISHDKIAGESTINPRVGTHEDDFASHWYQRLGSSLAWGRDMEGVSGSPGSAALFLINSGQASHCSQ